MIFPFYSFTVVNSCVCVCVCVCVTQFYEAMIISTSDLSKYAKNRFTQGILQNCLKICIAIMMPPFIRATVYMHIL